MSGTTSTSTSARVPGAALAGLALALAALGWLFVYIEYDAKKKRLVAAFKGLAQEGTHIDPLTLGGFARDVAVVANDGIDEVVKREVQRSAGRGVRNVNELESLLSAPSPEPKVSDRKSTRLNSSHSRASRMPSSA